MYPIISAWFNKYRFHIITTVKQNNVQNLLPKGGGRKEIISSYLLLLKNNSSNYDSTTLSTSFIRISNSWNSHNTVWWFKWQYLFYNNVLCIQYNLKFLKDFIKV